MASRKFILVPAVLFAVLAFLALNRYRIHASPQSSQDGARVPVLVELFTSEGCSDCPPADRILEELDSKQPIPHAQAIVLSEHVTYWNHQGWRDPFSLDEIDLRQKEYGSRFNLDDIYTPQAVIDGAAQMVGNNGSRVAEAVERAASSPKRSLTIADARWDNGAVSFTVHGQPDSGSKVIAVLAADASGSKVTKGENAGRTLNHVAVVRSIKEFNAGAADGHTLRLPGGSLAHDQSSSPARLVVFMVEKKTGHVTAVGEQALSR